MTIVAFAGDITVRSSNSGVILTKKGESWGGPWPTPDSTLEVTDVGALIQALQQVQQEKSYDSW